MTLMDWNQTLSVNVREIDEQHKQLIGMINELQGAMAERKGNEVLGDILEKMTKYTQFHFETEEKYFHKFKYEHAREHEFEHHDFVKKVMDFKTDFETGNIGLSVEVFNFLTSWLRHHIMVSDKAYTKCFNEHGLR